MSDWHSLSLGDLLFLTRMDEESLMRTLNLYVDVALDEMGTDDLVSIYFACRDERIREYLKSKHKIAITIEDES